MKTFFMASVGTPGCSKRKHDQDDQRNKDDPAHDQGSDDHFLSSGNLRVHFRLRRRWRVCSLVPGLEVIVGGAFSGCSTIKIL